MDENERRDLGGTQEAMEKSLLARAEAWAKGGRRQEEKKSVPRKVLGAGLAGNRLESADGLHLLSLQVRAAGFRSGEKPPKRTSIAVRGRRSRSMQV